MTKYIFMAILAWSSFTGCKRQVEKIDEETIVVVQPFGQMELALVDTVLHTFKQVYGVSAYSISKIDIPDYTFVNIKSPRYRADSLIRFLRDTIMIKIEKADYVMGLIDKDISTTKYSNYQNKEIKAPEYKYKDWGIYGLGFCPGETSIVSTYRLRNGTSKENFVLRLKKVSCHELGHNFGLPHCPNKDCIMQDAAETIKTIDNVELHLCQACRQKIGLSTN